MIYLILSAEIEIIDKERGEFKYFPLLKIGYTKNIDSRFDSYLLHNPGCKLLGTREGSTELESFLHSYFQKYSYPGRDREWFYYNQEIVDNFQSLQVGDEFLSKEEYIEGLREYIKSNISTPQELRSKYLDDLLKELENIKSEVEFDKEFHRSYTMEIWEKGYKREMEFLDSFDFLDLIKDFPERINLRENPWKNTATFYYRVTADYKKMNVEDFQNIINNKRKSTEELIEIYLNTPDYSSKLTLAKKYQKDAKNSSYRDDYVAVNKVYDESGNIILKPILNNLVMVNEIRAFKIQQIDYADRFSVFSTVHNKLTKDDIVNRQAYEFMEEYNSLTEARKKLILLCESSLSGRLSKEAINIVLSQIPESDYIKSYYENLGPERVKALGYIRSNVEKELGIVTFSQELLIDSIYSEFEKDKKYTLSSIKTKLDNIYKSINYSKTPKATDIENWFEIKEIQLSQTIDGKRKRIKAYELLKSKEHELRQELKYAN